MKELKTYVQEPYEAPAILDVLPVTTFVHGGESVTPGPDDNGDDF